MVRRGSTVRVRQRALKSPEIGIFVARTGTTEHLLDSEGLDDCGRPESARKRREEAPVGAFCFQRRHIDDLGTDLGARSTACDDVWLGVAHIWCSPVRARTFESRLAEPRLRCTRWATADSSHAFVRNRDRISGHAIERAIAGLSSLTRPLESDGQPFDIDPLHSTSSVDVLSC